MTAIAALPGSIPTWAGANPRRGRIHLFSTG